MRNFTMLERVTGKLWAVTRGSRSLQPQLAPQMHRVGQRSGESDSEDFMYEWEDFQAGWQLEA